MAAIPSRKIKTKPAAVNKSMPVMTISEHAFEAIGIEAMATVEDPVFKLPLETVSVWVYAKP